METRLDAFLSLAAVFATHHHRLFLVGGTVRDYLLSTPLSDMDAVSDATPEEMKLFLPDADYTYARFGSVRYFYQGIKFDLTTLREEESYLDSRHPAKIHFVKDLSLDVRRRDLTVNGLYLDDQLKVIDYVHGEEDLKNHLLRMIGDPLTRLKEDPLRIIRILRFALDYDFEIEPQLQRVILENTDLLTRLNPAKIQMEFQKIKCPDQNKIESLFQHFHIPYPAKVIK